jgi:hypothetical protein
MTGRNVEELCKENPSRNGCERVNPPFKEEELPICDNVTVQKCKVVLPGGGEHVCEIGTTDHECEVEEPEPPVTPEPEPIERLRSARNI